MASCPNLNAFWSTLQCCKKNYIWSAHEHNCEELFTLFDWFSPTKSRDYRKTQSHRQALLESPQKYYSTFLIEHITLFSKANGNVTSAKSCLMSWVLLLVFPRRWWRWPQPADTIREGSYTLWASPQQKIQVNPGRGSSQCKWGTLPVHCHVWIRCPKP